MELKLPLSDIVNIKSLLYNKIKDKLNNPSINNVNYVRVVVGAEYPLSPVEDLLVQICHNKQSEPLELMMIDAQQKPDTSAFMDRVFMQQLMSILNTDARVPLCPIYGITMALEEHHCAWRKVVYVIFQHNQLISFMNRLRP